MIARAAEWNPSVFSPKGKVNIYEIVDKYLDYAIQYDQPFILSKYNIQQHLGGDQVIFEMSLVFCLNLSDCWLKLEILQNDMNNFSFLQKKWGNDRTKFLFCFLFSIYLIYYHFIKKAIPMITIFRVSSISRKKCLVLVRLK